MVHYQTKVLAALLDDANLTGLLVVTKGTSELCVHRLDILLPRLRLPLGLPATHPGSGGI